METGKLKAVASSLGNGAEFGVASRPVCFMGLRLGMSEVSIKYLAFIL